MSAKATLYLDTRRARKDGTYPIKLRVSWKGRGFFYPLAAATIEDYEQALKAKPQKALHRELRKYLMGKLSEAESILEAMPLFDKVAFEQQFLPQTVTITTVTALYEKEIARLHKNGQISTSDIYKMALGSIQKYQKSKKPLLFTDLTPDWLQGFERWFLLNGRSKTTIGMYTRTLRTIFNIAIAEGLVSRDSYPFGDRKFQPPSSRNIKKALTLEEIRKLVAYPAHDEREAKARDLWIFSYLSNGINIKDICCLRYENVGDRFITFIRAKTANTKRVEESIQIALLPEIKAIIERWGNPPTGDPKQRVFPFLDKEATPLEVRSKVQLVTRFINDYMEKVAKAVGIPKEVKTYAARHSFATILKRSGTSVEFISESLGHRDLRTTQNYLDSFEDEMVHEQAKKLL